MASAIGDNSTKFARDQLKAFVERIERLEEEKKTVADDIRDVYTEAKGTGFDVKALRAIVRLRKQDANERREHEAILETYMHALGMLADTPLGAAAIRKATGKDDLPPTSPVPPQDTSDPPFALPAVAEEDEGLRVPEEA